MKGKRGWGLQLEGKVRRQGGKGRGKKREAEKEKGNENMVEGGGKVGRRKDRKRGQEREENERGEERTEGERKRR